MQNNRVVAFGLLWGLWCTGATSPFEKLGSLQVTPPAGWEVAQRAHSNGIQFAVFTKGDQTVRVFFHPKADLPIDAFLTGRGKLLGAETKTRAGWSVQTLSHQADTNVRPPAPEPDPIPEEDEPESDDPEEDDPWPPWPPWSAKDDAPTVYITVFKTTNGGSTYVGFSRAATEMDAKTNADRFMSKMEFGSAFSPFSLTGPAFLGKKYYLGWGAAHKRDPDMMQNEVESDVRHTQTVFEEQLGGNYLGKKLVHKEATGDAIKDAWKEIGTKLTNQDMYLQYSSGHGNRKDLAVGVTYEEMRDSVLAFPAKEIVIFTMACHSGGLVEAFNQKESEWKDFPSKGRSLFVMASSDVDSESGTGPGTDPDEPKGENGTAGSAFGHAVWKSITGSADGFVDGIKDGFVSLEEMREYATLRTMQIGHHRPVHTGAYIPEVIMTRVPNKAELSKFSGGTLQMTDAQVQKAVAKAQASLAVN